MEDCGSQTTFNIPQRFFSAGGLAACFRRVEASSYYDQDEALPSLYAAQRGAKISLIYMGALSHLEYLQIDRFAGAKFRLGYGFEC